MIATIGTQAPDHDVEAYVRGEHDAVTLRLSDFRDSWVVLVFYPRDFTFVCPTELVGFEQLRSEFEACGATILAASTDSYWAHRAWFGSDGFLADVSYPVIADTSHELTQAFGVRLADGAALRATFVLDPDGVVRHVTVSDLSVGRSVEETLRVVQALQTGELCPAGWRPGGPTLLAA